MGGVRALGFWPEQLKGRVAISSVEKTEKGVFADGQAGGMGSCLLNMTWCEMPAKIQAEAVITVDHTDLYFRACWGWS